jgi:hypothetical protein
VPPAPLGPVRLELHNERLSRRLPEVRVRRAHVGRSAPEFEQRAIAHAGQARLQLVRIELGLQRQVGQVAVVAGSGPPGPGAEVRTPPAYGLGSTQTSGGPMARF